MKRLSLTAEQVRRIRIDHSWSVRQAAIVLGVSRGAWQWYENNGVSNGIIAKKLINYIK